MSHPSTDLHRERLLVAALTAIQVCHMIDFVIMIPLGPQLTRILGITSSEFGLLVSIYTVAASVAGLVVALFVDRFDRKKALLTFFAAFIVATALCGFATSYSLLFFARLTAGAAGGVLSGMILSIIGDEIPESRRGAATGAVMSAFAISSIIGVPAGIALASLYNWQAPFFILAALGALVWVLAYTAIPNHMSRHLEHHNPARNPVRELLTLLRIKECQAAFLFTCTLTVSGFILIPFTSMYVVKNLGVEEQHLSFFYGIGGVATFFSARWVGRLSDRYGKLPVFYWMASLAFIPILGITQLRPGAPWALILTIFGLFMVGMNGRFVPSVALMTTIVPPQRRGSFMSLNSSLQQMSAGLAALISGKIITQAPTGELQNFDKAGYLAAFLSILAMLLIGRVRKVRVPT